MVINLYKMCLGAFLVDFEFESNKTKYIPLLFALFISISTVNISV